MEQVGPVITACSRRGPYNVQADEQTYTGLSYADTVDLLVDDVPGPDLADAIDAALRSVR